MTPPQHSPLFARQQELDLLCRSLPDTPPGKAWYLSGPPGQGKSFFAESLYKTLRDLSHRGKDRPLPVLAPAFRSFPLTAAEWLEGLAPEDVGSRRLIVIADDFDRLVTDQLPKKEAALLGPALAARPGVLLVALGRPGTLEEMGGLPGWKGFFIEQALANLGAEQCLELFREASGPDLPGDLAGLLALLAGGRPGNVLACAASGSTDPLRWLAAMEKGLEPRHRALWESLPPLERRVLNLVCRWGPPAFAADLAPEAGLTVNEASALLSRLAGRGLLAAERRGRANAYLARNRAFVLCRAFSAHPDSRLRLESFLSFCGAVYREGLAFSPFRRKPGDAKGPADRFPGYQPVFPGPCEILARTPKKVQEPPPEPGLDDLLLPVPDFPARILDLDPEGLSPAEQPERVLQAAADEAPENPEAWELYAGFLHRVRGRANEAEEAYLKSLELDANRASVWLGLGLLLQDLPERAVEAEQAFRISVSLAGEHASAHALLGRFFSRDPERLAQAEKELVRAVEIRPDFGAAWLALAEVLDENPDHAERAGAARERAEENLGREKAAFVACMGLSREAEPEDQSDLAREACGLLLEGEGGAAASAFERFCRLRPADPWAWAMLGFCLQSSGGDRTRCRAAVQKALELAPRQTLALACMGELLEREGRTREAVSCFEAAAAAEDAGGLVFARLGEDAAEKGRKEKAEEYFRRAISLEPDEPWAYAHLGKLLLGSPERLGDSRKALGRAVSLSPDYALARLWLARSLEALGEENLAFKEIQEAVMAAPASFGAWEALIVFSMEKLADAPAAADFARQYLERAEDKAAARRNLLQMVEAHGLSELAPLLGPEEDARPLPEQGASLLAQAEELAAAGDFPAALALAASFFDDSRQLGGAAQRLASLFLAAAPAGHGREALDALEARRENAAAATLAAALRLRMGLPPGTLAPEMLRAARDIAGNRAPGA